MKYVFLFAVMAFAFVAAGNAQAALSDSEKAVVIAKVMHGETDVLDQLFEGDMHGVAAAAPCRPGCYAMSSNPIAVNACSYFLSPQQCMQQFNNLGCIWSCQ